MGSPFGKQPGSLNYDKKQVSATISVFHIKKKQRRRDIYFGQMPL